MLTPYSLKIWNFYFEFLSSTCIFEQLFCNWDTPTLHFVMPHVPRSQKSTTWNYWKMTQLNWNWTAELNHRKVLHYGCSMTKNTPFCNFNHAKKQAAIAVYDLHDFSFPTIFSKMERAWQTHREEYDPCINIFPDKQVTHCRWATITATASWIHTGGNCWNIDNTSLALRRRCQFSCILLQSNWFREVTWGPKERTRRWKRNREERIDRGYVHLLVELLWSVLMISAPWESLCGISQYNVSRSCQSVVCGVSYSSLFSIMQSMRLGTHQRGS